MSKSYYRDKWEGVVGGMILFQRKSVTPSESVTTEELLNTEGLQYGNSLVLDVTETPTGLLNETD